MFFFFARARQCAEPANISTLLSAFKQHVGFHGKAWLRDYWRTHGRLWTEPLSDWARDDGTSKPIWNTRGYDFNIHRGDTLLEKLDYCHKNPITRGLVERAEDWPWSSYRYYDLDDRTVLTMDWDRAWPIAW